MIENLDEIMAIALGINENHRYITLLVLNNQKFKGSKVLLLALQVSSK